MTALSELTVDDLREREHALSRSVSFLLRERDKVQRAIAEQVPPPDMPPPKYRSPKQEAAFNCPRCGYREFKKKAAA